MLTAYATNRDKILNLLPRLSGVVSAEHFKKTLDGIRHKLSENRFTLVVVGQFKRGKTTFINALLGRDLLPAAVIPLTSIITVLKYGDALRIKVFFSNGSTKEIEHDGLPRYVTETHNPKNEKGVDRVEVFYPSDYLKNGVQIADTPGIASIHAHNTQVTYGYLPHADAAVFLVSVDPPITQAELHFLKDLKKDIAKVFFVQNKIDTANDSDREESLAFTKKVIEEEAGFKNIVIYPLSAKYALEGKLQNGEGKAEKSGLTAFERALDKFLMEEKGSVLLRSVVNKIEGIVSQEMLFAKIERKSLGMPLADLENKMKSFSDFSAELEQERGDIAAILKSELANLIKEVLEEDLNKLRKERTDRLVKEIEKLYRAHRAKRTRELEKILEEYLDRQIRDVFSAWSLQEEKILKTRLEKILDRFASRMNSIAEKIAALSSKLFDIPAEPIFAKEPLSAETGFWFKLQEDEDSLSMLIGSITRSLPKILGHTMVLEAAKERAAELVDRHCGRMRHDFVRRIEKTAEDCEKRISQNADAIKENIADALLAARDLRRRTAEELAERRNAIDGMLEKLAQFAQEIKTMRNSL